MHIGQIVSLLRCIGLLGVILLWADSTVAQEGSLEYRYGPSAGGNGSSNQSASQIVNSGIGMLGSGNSSGTIGGKIGSTIPLPAQSAQALETQAERRERIAQQVMNAPVLPLHDPEAYLKAYNQKRYVETGDPAYLREWESEDQKLIEQLGNVYFQLENAEVSTLTRQELKKIGLGAIVDADHEYAQGNHEEATFLYSIAQATADILVGIDPFTGTVRAFYEATTGFNLITGAKLSDFERGVAILSTVTLGYGGKIEKGIDLFCRASRGAFQLVYASRAVSFARQVGAAIFTKPSSPFIIKDTQRALEILVHASAGPRLRSEAIISNKYMGATISKTIDERAPELYDLSNPKVYNGYAGELSRAEVDKVGFAFVGDEFIPFTDSNGKILGFKSLDGLRGYRLPSPKKALNDKVQANLETFAPPGSARTKELSDLHIDVID